jgi:hypothetical protein
MLHSTQLPLACLILTWAATASAEDSLATVDEYTLTMFSAGAALLLAIVLVRRLRTSGHARKSGHTGRMTLKQNQSSSGGADPQQVAQPKPMAMSLGAIKPPSPSDIYMSELEKQFPRIVENLVAIWPNQESANYLQSLVFNDRGNRKGFNNEVAADIMDLYGIKVNVSDGAWNAELESDRGFRLSPNDSPVSWKE